MKLLVLLIFLFYYTYYMCEGLAFLQTVMVLHLWLFFTTAFFGCGNNWKLLLFRHLQGRAYVSFSVVACKTKEFKWIRIVCSYFFSLETLVINIIPHKSCILAKVSKLFKKVYVCIWWNVASKTGIFQMAINVFTLSVQRRKSRWLAEHASHLTW